MAEENQNATNGNLINFNDIVNSKEDFELPKEAPESLQKAVEQQMGGGNYEVDPDNFAFPKVSLAKVESIDWKNENERSVFTDSFVYRGNTSKTKQVNGQIVALQIFLLRPRTGFFKYDSINGKPLCKTVASFPDTGESFYRFSDLPAEVPLYGPSEYENPKTPRKETQKFGLYGQKGMFCSDCVKAGEHVTNVETTSGELSEQSCRAVGDLLVVVTGFGICMSNKKTYKEYIEWKSWNEIYNDVSEEDSEEVNIQQTFDTPPIVRLSVPGKMLSRKTRFGVWTQEHEGADNASPSANYVPSNVENVGSYLQSLHNEKLDDGRSWIKVVEKEEGSEEYISLYRGLHELYLTYPKDEPYSQHVNLISMMKTSDFTHKVLEENGVNALTYYSHQLYKYYIDSLRNQIEKKELNPYKPFTPPELAGEDDKPSLVSSESENGKGNETTTPNVEVVKESFSS